MFQNIGYTTIPTARDYASALVEFFPVLKDNFTELRKWTVRFSSPAIPEVPADPPTLPILGEPDHAPEPPETDEGEK
jgi:hypothetical protein